MMSAMSIEIREQLPGDDEAVHRVVGAAFADGGRVAALAVALRARTGRQASLVAVDGDRIVGHTHLSVSWIDDPRRLVEVLVLSPLSVTPDRQREGIGGKLLAEAVRAAAHLGAPLLFLEGDPRYYSRHGWLPATEHGFTPPSTRIPGPAFQVRPLPGYDPAAINGAFVYNDTFWTHDCVGLRGTPADR